MREKLVNLEILWLLLESAGFIRNGWIGLWQRTLKHLGLIGTMLDRRSIEGMARKYRIPVLHIQDPNSPDFIRRLREMSPDLIINQSELFLREGILSVPRLGIVNRHASLLPRFRGRLGSFRSHAQTPPEYGITIHFVEKELDAGPIILQERLEIDPRSSYAKVLDILFGESPRIMLEALKRIEGPDFVPAPNSYQGTKPYPFPTLEEARSYRETMKKRRQRSRK
ncbi:MAG: hypothetical protein HYU64_11405 [Armatimonadetes bacterium]|nr:hypothetical protein [Armatimonadota bacterium]